MNTQIIDTLTHELSGIAWLLCSVVILAGVLTIAWKWIEKKILAFAEKKAWEIKQKKLDEANAAEKIHIERNGPTFEEWKATKEAEEYKKD